jgi:hypothetical protein
MPELLIQSSPIEASMADLISREYASEAQLRVQQAASNIANLLEKARNANVGTHYRGK